jgi:hypothetical protein
VAGGRPRRREVAGGDHATVAPARAWAGTRGYGPTWATGTRALDSFFQNFKTSTNFVIPFGNPSFVQNSPKFG